MRQSLKAQTTDIDQKIGARIREFRLLRSMSQGALAEKLGITFQQLQKYEKGTNRVSASALILICQELGITPNHILGAFFDNDEEPELVH
ncbi:helix-turn-helix domain-containing protein [Sinorhizobium meliloti]|uniref:helix-turn-helix domain-containing protein n=1 Tax=Rhizobium meliloti TaxID=382 RepID=UPI001F367804|nr:helix-turn-helix transcriptional regulator [Sinorhizobium meliloti]